MTPIQVCSYKERAPLQLADRFCHSAINARERPATFTFVEEH